MSGTTIGWDNAVPAATDLVGQGDDVIRSFKSNLQGGLSAEHLWPSGGGLSGVHALGSARVFVGTNSQVSSADTSGRLMFNSTRSTLHYVGAEGTALLGLASGLEVTSPAISSASRWQSSVVSFQWTNTPSGPITSGISAGMHYHFASVETTGGSVVTSIVPLAMVYSTNTLFNQFQVVVFDVAKDPVSVCTHPFTVNILTIGFGPA